MMPMPPLLLRAAMIAECCSHCHAADTLLDEPLLPLMLMPSLALITPLLRYGAAAACRRLLCRQRCCCADDY